MSGRRFFAVSIIHSVVVAVMLLVPASAASQGLTGASLSGWVRTTLGAAVPRAMVRLHNTSTGAARQTAARDDGRFFFEDVPVGGPYRLDARALGYEPTVIDGLELHLGDRVVRTIVLGTAAAKRLAEVVVRESTLRDAGAGGPASTITGHLTRNLPLPNRDFVGLFALSPQATGASQLSVSGQHRQFNSIQVDGASSNDFFGTSVTPGAGAGAKLPALLMARANVRHSSRK